MVCRCALHLLGSRGAEVVELQAVGDARVEEHLDGVKGHDQALGNAVEGELHLEEGVVDGQLPEAVLEHHRHLFRVFLAQAVGEVHARGIGLERDVEVMLAREPGFRHAREHGPDDPAHGILHEAFVVDIPLTRHRLQKTTGFPVAQGSGGLLLPGALRNRAWRC